MLSYTDTSGALNQFLNLKKIKVRDELIPREVELLEERLDGGWVDVEEEATLDELADRDRVGSTLVEQVEHVPRVVEDELLHRAVLPIQPCTGRNTSTTVEALKF